MGKIWVLNFPIWENYGFEKDGCGKNMGFGKSDMGKLWQNKCSIWESCGFRDFPWGHRKIGDRVPENRGAARVWLALPTSPFREWGQKPLMLVLYMRIENGKKWEFIV